MVSTMYKAKAHLCFSPSLFSNVVLYTGQRAMNSPAHSQQQQQQQQHGTPQSRALSPRSKGPTTSTPNKDPPSARRCLPLNDPHHSQVSTPRRYHDDSNIQYGRTIIPSVQAHRLQIEDEAVIYSEKKAAQANGFYQGPEAAFIARTAVVSFFFLLLRCDFSSLSFVTN